VKLRPYQERAIEALRAEYARGKRAPVLVLPTGAGKTVVASEIIRSAVSRGRRVLFLAHRAELITQSVAKLEAAGVTDVRIIQAATDLGNPRARRRRRQHPDAHQVGRADARGGPRGVRRAHHTVARTWARIAERYRGSLLMGMTATPQRSDGKGLGDIFDSLVVGSTVAELTALGHLVPCRVWSAPRKLESAQVILNPVAAYQQHAAGERAVIFCVTVEHARQVADEMCTAGIACGTVDGAGSMERRRDALARFRRGELRAIACVHVLTEGWDDPGCAVCILARRPQHDGTFLQMVGRVLRPAPGKTHATLIDLCGSVHEHGTPEMEREFSLDGRGIKKVDRDAIRQCLSCGGVFLAGPEACPMCGVALPRREMTLPHEIGGELIDLSTLPKLPARSYTLSITAKYAGWCRACSSPISVGEQIYWNNSGGKGSARHAECPARSASL
jgi:DNA repair protein RadD